MIKYFVILIIFFITISINESYAEMSYSEFQDFCKETKNTNLDLMPIDQRLLAYLCDFLDSELSEKYWNWIGADLNWKNFAHNVSDEYAQEIPLFVEKGFEDSLVVNTSISGRDSFPPPMSVYISFYYDEDNKTKRFGEKYMVKISGEFTKAKDHRLSPLKLFNIGYHLDEIQCKENLILVQKYDGSPACVIEQTKQKLIERGWTAKNDSTLSKINTSCMTIEQSKQIAPFFKIPSYLPEGYSYVCSRSGMHFESYIVYYNQEFPTNWQIHELVSDGAIFIYQTDERNFVDEKEYATYGSPEQRTRETYDSVIEGNPSLNPQLITINGMLAYAVDSCPDCGMQIANFTDGSSIQKSTSTETKIKFIDENGVKYMLKTTLPLSELIKVAESLQ